jgi:UDP-3-O-[3-hydroxymyristoyl] glucosamine N-acyltransferase
MAIKLSELAKILNCRLHGEDCQIENVAEISHAVGGQLAFIHNPAYIDKISSSNASAVIIKEEWLSSCNKPALVSKNPRLDFAKVASLLNPVKLTEPGVSDTAVIEGNIKVPSSVFIGANAVIQSGVILGENVQIGPGCVIANNVQIGDNTVIYPNVTIGHSTRIGDNCVINSGVVIGTDGFGYVKEGESYLKVPQLGNVQIGNNVDIGANTTIDRGALLDTVIGNGVKLDNQIQIGHNVVIGENTLISANSGVSGSTRIGKNCLIGGGVGIRDNIEIVDNVIITGRTFVSSSIKEPGSYSSSVLVDKTANWKKNVIRFKQLDDIAKRLKKLEQENN